MENLIKFYLFKIYYNKFILIKKILIYGKNNYLNLKLSNIIYKINSCFKNFYFINFCDKCISCKNFNNKLNLITINFNFKNNNKIINIKKKILFYEILNLNLKFHKIKFIIINIINLNSLKEIEFIENKLKKSYKYIIFVVIIDNINKSSKFLLYSFNKFFINENKYIKKKQIYFKKNKLIKLFLKNNLLFLNKLFKIKIKNLITNINKILFKILIIYLKKKNNHIFFKKPIKNLNIIKFYNFFLNMNMYSKNYKSLNKFIILKNLFINYNKIFK